MIKNVFGSATKIVFILIAIGLVAFTAIGKIEAKDFMVLATMVFSAYYSNNRTSASNEKKSDAEADLFSNDEENAD